jgi:hypothetical protein
MNTPGGITRDHVVRQVVHRTWGCHSFLPVVFAAFGALRTLVLMISVRPRGQYLREVEDMALRGQPLEGWESFYKTHYRRGVVISIAVFWVLLCSVTFAIATGLTVLCGAADGPP